MLIIPARAEVVLKPSMGTKMKPLAKARSADPSELIEYRAALLLPTVPGSLIVRLFTNG